MSLWVDKHRPRVLDDLDYHRSAAQNLKELVRSGDFPHLLFYGPSGAGKRTRISCLLREIYGSGVDRAQIHKQVYETASKKKVECNTYSSNFHVEVNPSEAGFQDRLIVQELIKSLAESHPLDNHPFKVVVIQEADKLTRDAQDALRRTMEKYVSSCRIILCALSTSRITPAIQSRCLLVRIASPVETEITRVLQLISRKEQIIAQVEFCVRIARASEGNLRRAILMFEACRADRYPFTENQQIQFPDWEIYLKETAFQIVQEQSPAKLLAVRERISEMLCRCIPSEVIFKGLVKGIVGNCDNQLKAEICSEAARCQWRCARGSKDIIHIEEFIAKFMAVYKRFIEQSIGDGFED